MKALEKPDLDLIKQANQGRARMARSRPCILRLLLGANLGEAALAHGGKLAVSLHRPGEIRFGVGAADMGFWARPSSRPIDAPAEIALAKSAITVNLERRG